MPRYEIRSANEGDMSNITDLVVEAMSGDTFDQSLFPPLGNTPHQQASSNSNRRTWMQDLWSRQLANPNTYLLVAHLPAQPNDIAGFACWHYAEPASVETPLESVTKDALGESLPAGMSPTAYQECVEKLEAAKKRVLDLSQPCYHLTMLAASARHARKGIGSMLFEWASRRADAEGALIYLEATPVGLALYEKFGCRKVAEVSFSGGGERVIMIRQVQTPQA